MTAGLVLYVARVAGKFYNRAKYKVQLKNETELTGYVTLLYEIQRLKIKSLQLSISPHTGNLLKILFF